MTLSTGKLNDSLQPLESFESFKTLFRQYSKVRSKFRIARLPSALLGMHTQFLGGKME